MKEVVCMFFVGVLLSLNLYGDSVSVNKEKSGFVWSDATEESLSESEYNRVILGYMKEKYPEEAKRLQREAEVKRKIEIKKNTTLIGNLMWQDNEAAKKTRLNWQDAKNYCASLSLGGYSDWRLAKKEELQMLFTKKNKLKYITPNGYWSSTIYENNNYNAWTVYFRNGYVDYGSEDYSRYIRCVRDEQ